MPEIATPIAPAAAHVPQPVRKGIALGTADLYEQLYAYGQAMGWMEKPFEFVLKNWLASRI
jgi:hypothetical protein